jgi:hypothetical protein
MFDPRLKPLRLCLPTARNYPAKEENQMNNAENNTKFHVRVMVWAAHEVTIEASTEEEALEAVSDLYDAGDDSFSIADGGISDIYVVDHP